MEIWSIISVTNYLLYYWFICWLIKYILSNCFVYKMLINAHDGFRNPPKVVFIMIVFFLTKTLKLNDIQFQIMWKRGIIKAQYKSWNQLMLNYKCGIVWYILHDKSFQHYNKYWSKLDAQISKIIIILISADISFVYTADTMKLWS